MISVCIATYNGETYLREQLDSILPQLEQEDEIVVSDDGSTDQTIAIIQSYVKKDPRVRYIKGPGQGLIANFEYALSNSTGELIFLADQDDVWLPNKVKVTKNYFQQHPEIDVTVSDLVIVDDSLTMIYPSYFDYRKVQTGLVHNLIKNKYIGAGMAFRKSMKQEILPIPPAIPMHDMWIGTLADVQHKTGLIKETLTLYRRHDQNASQIKSNASFWQQLIWRYTLIMALIKRKLFSK